MNGSYFSVPHLAYKEDAWQQNEINLVSEGETELWLNGRLYCHAVCTPEHLEDLAVGRMVADGVISPQRPQSLTVSSDPFRAEVNASVPCSVPALPADTDSLWTVDDLQKLASTLRETPLYRATRSIHCAVLMRHGEQLCLREDIGRHNALDKVIGWAVLHGVDLSECIVFSSGRLPLDMVQKALHAGIPVMASKSLPTAESVALAGARGLTLLHISERWGILRFP